MLAQVWKTIVPNTPRTLREVMPILTNQIITALETKKNDKGITRVKFADGWISEKAGDGTVLLEPAEDEEAESSDAETEDTDAETEDTDAETEDTDAESAGGSTAKSAKAAKSP